MIKEIIERESSIVSCDNIVIGGLSQVCATGLVTLLSLESAIGGFFGMSGWFPSQEDIQGMLALANDDNADPFT